MDRGAWWVTIHGITKSWTRLTHTTVLTGDKISWAFPWAFEQSLLFMNTVAECISFASTARWN